MNNKLKSLYQKHWVTCLLLAILVAAACLRFYQLGNVPHGMTWDEAAIGYNGFAIWTTGRDEWLKILPISFRSFGDFKAPLMIYITGFFTRLLGMELWVIRLPAAINGVIAIAAFMWLTWELTNFFVPNHSHQTKITWSLIAGLLLCITPWHIHFSRIGMESGSALLFVMVGCAAWLRSLRLFSHTLTWRLFGWLRPLTYWLAQPWVWQLISVFFVTLSLYTYHSAKIVAPLLGLCLLWVGRRQLWQRKYLVLVAGFVATLLLVPLIYDSLYGSGAERLAQAAIKTEGKTQLEVATLLLTNFAQHFTPEFLVGGQTTSLRHGDGTWGVLLWPTFLLVLLAVGVSAFARPKLSRLSITTVAFAITWILIGTIPAAIGQEVPHANRALLSLPGWIWLAVVGFDWACRWTAQPLFDRWFKGSHGEGQLVLKTFIGLVVLIHALFLCAYLHTYYTTFAAQSADAFQDGYLETISYVVPYEYGDETHKAVDKILMDNGYGQPYIYLLVARKTNPFWYHSGSLIKYEFPDKLNEGALLRPNTLVVASGKQPMPWEKAQHLIYGSDGQIRFGIFVNQ